MKDIARLNFENYNRALVKIYFKIFFFKPSFVSLLYDTTCDSQWVFHADQKIFEYCKKSANVSDSIRSHCRERMQLREYKLLTEAGA
jgi:hypothetical protein